VAELDIFEYLPALEAQLPDYFGAITTPTEGGRDAHQELIDGTDPAAGAEYVYSVPGDWNVRPLSVLATLTTSAVAGDRAVVLEYRDGEGERYNVAGTDVTVGPSSVQQFNFQVGAAEGMWPVDDVAVVPMPGLVVWPTYSLAVRIIDGDSADQLSRVRLTVEKYTTAPKLATGPAPAAA
jgi:hypothetical protein